ncbi:MAG TPA: MFS transporter, partial [Bryobacteraceae bacterium]|nr:MFS transporter [Bryobacteraceae bacterium]
FPAAIKSVAEWFPKRERAFATGIFNAGTNVASMFGPFLIAYLTIQYGWRACFIITASAGLLLMIVWLLLYRTPEAHKSVNKAELEHIRSDAPAEDNEPKLSWKAAASLKQTWGFSIAKFLTDPVWWFYLWWLPLYLTDVHKLTLDQIRWPILLVYGIADVGSVFFGWVPGYLIRQGWDAGRARKAAMAMCAALMPISSLAVFADNVWLAVALVSVATACHQGWSANLFTTTSDVFPKRVVGSVVGIGGCVGGLGSAVFASLVPGIIIQHFGYTPAFLAMGFFHLTALLVVHKLMGGLKPITLAPVAVT